MGFWEGTCMLSHLPISGGERIRAVLLVETNEEAERNASGFCKPADLWTPLFPPMPCVYDAYGGAAELPRGQWVKLLRAAFRGRGFVDASADLPSPVDIDTCPAKKLLGIAGRGALRIRGVRVRYVDGVEKRFKKTRRVGLSFIREAVYEELLDVRARASLHAQADAYVDWLSRPRKSRAGEQEGPHPELWRSLDDTGTPSVRPFRALQRALLSQRPSESPERRSTTQQVVRAAADVVLLGILFANGRLHWGPTSGKGSQDTETFVQRALARATLAEADRIDAEHARLEEDDEDEDEEEDSDEGEGQPDAAAPEPGVEAAIEIGRSRFDEREISEVAKALEAIDGKSTSDDGAFCIFEKGEWFVQCMSRTNRASYITEVVSHRYVPSFEARLTDEVSTFLDRCGFVLASGRANFRRDMSVRGPDDYARLAAFIYGVMAIAFEHRSGEPIKIKMNIP